MVDMKFWQQMLLVILMNVVLPILGIALLILMMYLIKG